MSPRTPARSIAAARPPLRGDRADGRADAFASGRRRDVIQYALACHKGHTFESWFQNSAAYDKQAKRKLIECPVCGSLKVEKAIMAPRLARKNKSTSIAVRDDMAPAQAEAAAPDSSPVAMISQ